MGKLTIIFIAFLAINLFMTSALPCYSDNLTSIPAIIERVLILLEASTAIVNKLLSYLLAQIDQLIFDIVDELLLTVVQTISDFIENLFSVDCYRSILSRIPAELQELLKSLFKSFAHLLNEIIAVLSGIIKVLGQLIGRRTVLQEFTSLITIIIQNGLDEVRYLTRNSLTDPQVLLWAKDTANDLTQCSNIVLKSVTCEIDFINNLVDKSGILVTKILQNLIKCLTLDLNSVQGCLDTLIGGAKETLTELKDLLVVDNAADVTDVLIKTQKCVHSVINNLKENLNHVADREL